MRLWTLPAKLRELSAALARTDAPGWAAIVLDAAARLEGPPMILLQDRHSILDDYPSVRDALVQWAEHPAPRLDGLRFRIRSSPSQGLGETRDILIELVRDGEGDRFLAGFALNVWTWHMEGFIPSADPERQARRVQAFWRDLDYCQESLAAQLVRAGRVAWPRRRVSIIRWLPCAVKLE